MDYKLLLDALINNADSWVTVRIANFNSAQASLRRSLKRYNANIDSLEIGCKYSLVSRSKGDGEWELKLIPLDGTAKIEGHQVKFVIIDDPAAREVSDDEFNWSIN